MYVQWHVHVDDITVIYTHIKSFEMINKFTKYITEKSLCKGSGILT